MLILTAWQTGAHSAQPTPTERVRELYLDVRIQPDLQGPDWPNEDGCLTANQESLVRDQEKQPLSLWHLIYIGSGRGHKIQAAKPCFWWNQLWLQHRQLLCCYSVAQCLVTLPKQQNLIYVVIVLKDNIRWWVWDNIKRLSHYWGSQGMFHDVRLEQ